jgi:hypothetical protein
VHRRLGLLSRWVEVLLEVALPVQQRDRDDGDRQVGGGAEGISGEHAESATIGGDGLLEADLHGEVGDAGARRSVRH